MSVIACSRGNCEEIMCHMLILHRSKYICTSCFNELEKWKETWRNVAVDEVYGLIEIFMDSQVGDYIGKNYNKDDVDKRFRELIEN